MKKTAASLLTLMAAAPLQAQDIALDEILVSPSLVATETSRTGATVDVVTAEDMQATGEISVSDLLARLPGVSYTRNGGLGATTTLRIRGLGSAYQAVRIDGIDVADASGTKSEFDFGSLTAGGIDRIEVLRGSQSAIYGSEAVAGVIDIATYRPRDPGVSGQLSLEGGSNRTFTGGLSTGLLTERGELAFSVARTVSDGISQAASGTERDGFDTTFYALSGAYDLTEDLRIGAAFIARDSDLDIDGPGAGGIVDTDDRALSRLRGGRIFADLTLGQVQSVLAYAATDTRREYPGGYIEVYEGERRALSLPSGRSRWGWRASRSGLSARRRASAATRMRAISPPTPSSARRASRSRPISICRSRRVVTTRPTSTARPPGAWRWPGGWPTT